MTSITRVVQTSIALLAIGFAALTLIMFMTLRLGDRARVLLDEAVTARDLRASASEARASVFSAESSQRGYVLTGNQIYLAPYGTAKATVQRELDTVRRLLVGNVQGQPSLQRLMEVVTEKFFEMDRSIALKREQKDGEALSLIRSNRGKALMDQANVFFTGISRAADERLTLSVDEQSANAARLRWTTIAGGILIIVVIALVAATVGTYTRDLAAAREEVAGLNRGLENRVRDRTAELARANQEIQRFAQVVSHDLRAPLVSIVGFAGEIESGVGRLKAALATSGGSGALGEDAEVLKEVVREDLPEAIGFIRSSAEKMDRLISSVLKLSREGRQVLLVEPVQLDELVRSSADAIRHQLSAAGGMLSLDLAIRELVTDRSSLEQVIANLLDNAIKYRSPDRPLRIDLRSRRSSGNRIAIEVADNGRGIAERDTERVFDLYARAGRPDQPGEGVGLAHVRTIVRNLGGDVSVISSVDTGTTFRVELPFRPPPSADQPQDEGHRT